MISSVAFIDYPHCIGALEATRKLKNSSSKDFVATCYIINCVRLQKYRIILKVVHSLKVFRGIRGKGESLSKDVG